MYRFGVMTTLDDLDVRIVLEELLARGVTLTQAGPAGRVRSNFTNSLKSPPVRVS